MSSAVDAGIVPRHRDDILMPRDDAIAAMRLSAGKRGSAALAAFAGAQVVLLPFRPSTTMSESSVCGTEWNDMNSKLKNPVFEPSAQGRPSSTPKQSYSTPRLVKLVANETSLAGGASGDGDFNATS